MLIRLEHKNSIFVCLIYQNAVFKDAMYEVVHSILLRINPIQLFNQYKYIKK